MRPDPGLATERTTLAWDRTAIAIVCGAVVVTRLGYGRLGAAAFVSIVLAVPLALGCVVDRRRTPRSDGRALAAVAAATAVIAAVEVASLLA